VDLKAIRAQLAATEHKAVNAENSNRALAEEIARLKATRATISQTDGRAVFIPAAMSAPTRPAGDVPAGVNLTSRSAPTPVTAGPGPGAKRTHVIVTGDTLSGISVKYYGTASRWPDILAANRDTIRDERTLALGRILRIP
jgi:nucleoid-associated protein YgaU